MAGYYFRLPAIEQLTISQQSPLYEPQQIALSGGPGTGKSVVSLWRHITNYEKGKQSLLLTYTTTLKQYLKACCRLKNTSAAMNVGTLYRNKPVRKRDEIIVDEAQDMSNDYYQEIMQYGKISYGADDSQILYPEHCTTQFELQQLFPDNVAYVLDKNFRNTRCIMQLARQAFPYASIPRSIIEGLSNNVGEKPVLLISNGSKYERTNEKQNNAIERIINSFRAEDHNIALLVPWKSDAQVFENVLKDKGIEYSIFYEDSQRFPQGAENISNVHITTFKSAKGLEFDTVIIPNFDKCLCTPIHFPREETIDKAKLQMMKKIIDRLEHSKKDHDILISEVMRPDGDYDVNYKKLMCSWEDVYVACTRARSNLYLISNSNLASLSSVSEKEIL